MPDPIQLAISALVDHLRANVPELGGKVAKGWPDPEKEIPLPSASVSHGDADRIGHDAAEVLRVPVPGSAVLVDVTYAVGDYTVPVQIDLWATKQSARGEIGDLVRALFTDPEVGDDLRLVLDQYADQLATFQIEDWRDTNDADSAKRGEWRQTINLTLEVPEVSTKRQSLLLTADATVDVYNADEIMT